MLLLDIACTRKSLVVDEFLRSIAQSNDSLPFVAFDSATTILVLTLGSGVDGFTLDPDVSRFLHTHQDIRIPPNGALYSFNEANFNDFDEPVRKYLSALKHGSSSIKKR